MKKCPFCQEEIQDSAIKCRFCGEFLYDGEVKNQKEMKKSKMTKKEIQEKNKGIHQAILTVKTQEKHTESEIKKAYKILKENGISDAEIEKTKIKNLEILLKKNIRTDEEQAAHDRKIEGWAIFYIILGIFILISEFQDARFPILGILMIFSSGLLYKYKSWLSMLLFTIYFGTLFMLHNTQNLGTNSAENLTLALDITNLAIFGQYPCWKSCRK